MVDKELIKKNFSLQAEYYDKYSALQNACALKLINKIADYNFTKILDIGCGTGNYTQLLAKRFPQSQIKALDISFEMIAVAQRKFSLSQIEFIVGDAENFEFKETFDLITSNASFQWFNDLEKTLTKYQRLLVENGVFAFSIFGPSTLEELQASLKKLGGENMAISSANFPSSHKIEAIFKNIRNISMEEEVIQKEYSSLLELLEKIKYSGTRGEGLKNKIAWTPKSIAELERIYKEMFGSIRATYQIFYYQGIK